nr:hypothetical protein [Tanacetum cinerariifolium]
MISKIIDVLIEEQAAKAQDRKLPVCYDDDDDEEESNSLKDNIISELPSCSAITTNEPIDSLSMGACQIVQKKHEEKRIEEEQAAKAQNRKLPVCYDDDDDEEESNSLKDNIISELPSCSAVTPSEPIDSLSHLHQQGLMPCTSSIKSNLDLELLGLELVLGVQILG